MSIALTAAPFSSLIAGDGIIVTSTGGEYTVAIDSNSVPSQDDLHSVTLLVTNHTSQISALQETDKETAAEITDIKTDVNKLHDSVDAANEIAVEAKEEATLAQQTANEAVSAVNDKQDLLTAGENISISNNVISASVAAYGKATTSQNGLMTTADRGAAISGVYTGSSVSVSTTGATITYTKNSSDDDGSAYSESSESITIPAATTTTAGAMSASDKSKLDGVASGAEVNVQADWTQTTTTADDYIKNKPSLATVATSGSYSDLSNRPTVAQFTLQTTDPGTGGTLAANNFIVVYEA